MNTEKDPVSIISKHQKNKINWKKKLKKVDLLTLSAILIVSILCYYGYNALRIQRIYESLNISFKSVKEIEYGTANYDTLNLVNSVSDGKIKKYTKNLDTSKVGTQKLVFEVVKDDIVKKFSINVKIKDTQVPNILFKNDKVDIYAGDAYDLKENIQSVNDVVDGEIPYSDSKLEGKAYYIISSDVDYNTPGSYTVTVTASDSNGNISELAYVINVIAKPTPVVQQVEPQNTNIYNTNTTYSNAPASVDTSSVLAAARSLLGTRYVSGGTSPETGFDCSGFTSYIYGVTGTSISRSSAGQLSNGFAVSESDLQPGDIIIWANNGSNSAAHSSVYAGDNTIIHATSNKGVQQTNLDNWKAWGQHIIGIRRV